MSVAESGIQSWVQSLERLHISEKLKSKRGGGTVAVYLIKYIVHNFIAKLCCLTNTVTALFLSCMLFLKGINQVYMPLTFFPPTEIVECYRLTNTISLKLTIIWDITMLIFLSMYCFQ